MIQVVSQLGPLAVDLAVSDGGTAASNAADARENLGVNTLLAERDLVLADLAPGLVDFLDSFADGFNSAAGIDAANSSNYSTANIGYVQPATNDTTEGTANATGGGTSTGGYTLVDRSWQIDNGALVSKFAVYSTVAGAFYAKIANEDSSTQFDFLLSEGPFNHTGSGWETFALSTPFSVPGTGTIRAAGCWTSGGAQSGLPSPSRAYRAGNATGNDQSGFANAAGGCYAYRVTYQGSPLNVDVRSVSRAVRTVPTSMNVYMLVKEVDALTLNSNFLVFASRNGNTTYVQGTAARLAVLANGLSLIVAPDINVSGQGSAKDLRWRVTSNGNKMFQIHAVSVYGE